MPFIGSDHLAVLIPLILLALIFFGPKRLPELGSSIGKTITEFKKSMKETGEPSATPPAVPTTQAPQQLTSAAPAAPVLPATTTEPTPTTQE